VLVGGLKKNSLSTVIFLFWSWKTGCDFHGAAGKPTQLRCFDIDIDIDLDIDIDILNFVV
jgi:hypothetical protein